MGTNIIIILKSIRHIGTIIVLYLFIVLAFAGIGCNTKYRIIIRITYWGFGWISEI